MAFRFLDVRVVEVEVGADGVGAAGVAGSELVAAWRADARVFLADMSE